LCVANPTGNGEDDEKEQEEEKEAPTTHGENGLSVILVLVGMTCRRW